MYKNSYEESENSTFKTAEIQQYLPIKVFLVAQSLGGFHDLVQALLVVCLTAAFMPESVICAGL